MAVAAGTGTVAAAGATNSPVDTVAAGDFVVGAPPSSRRTAASTTHDTGDWTGALGFDPSSGSSTESTTELATAACGAAITGAATGFASATACVGRACVSGVTGVTGIVVATSTGPVGTVCGNAADADGDGAGSEGTVGIFTVCTWAGEWSPPVLAEAAPGPAGRSSRRSVSGADPDRVPAVLPEDRGAAAFVPLPEGGLGGVPSSRLPGAAELTPAESVEPVSARAIPTACGPTSEMAPAISAAAARRFSTPAAKCLMLFMFSSLVICRA